MGTTRTTLRLKKTGKKSVENVLHNLHISMHIYILIVCIECDLCECECECERANVSLWLYPFWRTTIKKSTTKEEKNNDDGDNNNNNNQQTFTYIVIRRNKDNEYAIRIVMEYYNKDAIGRRQGIEEEAGKERVKVEIKYFLQHFHNRLRQFKSNLRIT